MSDKLTYTEMETAKQLARGLSVKEISIETHRSDSTINAHKARVYSKLGIHCAVELAHYALHHGWIENKYASNVQ